MGAARAELPDVRVYAPVAKVTPASAGRGPLVHAAGSGDAEEYDAVVFATHTDTTLAALGSKAPEVAPQTFETGRLDFEKALRFDYTTHTQAANSRSNIAYAAGSASCVGRALIELKRSTPAHACG